LLLHIDTTSTASKAPKNDFNAGTHNNHLTRLFHTTYGVTISAYIRQRRAERARHLLLHSTLPIKAIAAQVGIADLHLFNKTIRRVLHDSPRRVRDRFDS